MPNTLKSNFMLSSLASGNLSPIQEFTRHGHFIK